jgi:Ca2+/Na+ antiporter
MNKKLVSLFTMVTFIIFSLSCYIMKKEKIETVAFKREKIAILGVVKKSGDTIEFAKENPGRIYKDSIIGTAERVTKNVVIERANIKGTRINGKGKILVFTTKDGKIFNVLNGSLREEKDKFVFTGTYVSHESISIPLSDVKTVKFKKFNFFATLIPVTCVVGLIALLVVSSIEISIPMHWD